MVSTLVWTRRTQQIITEGERKSPPGWISWQAFMGMIGPTNQTPTCAWQGGGCIR